MPADENITRSAFERFLSDGGRHPPGMVMTDAVVIAAFEPADASGDVVYVYGYPDGFQASHRTKGLLYEVLDLLGAITQDDLDGG